MLDALDDEPLTLEEACKVIFKSAISPASLRAEARRGRLVIERIGRTDFVTRAAVREMRNQCRLPVPPQKVPASGSNQLEHGRDAQPSPPSGSSETTGELKVALASLLMNADKLNKPSATISRSGIRRQSAKVIRLKPQRSMS